MSDPYLPEGAEFNPSAPYNQEDAPVVVEYAVLKTGYRLPEIELLTTGCWNTATKYAKAYALKNNACVDIKGFYDNGVTVTCAEYAGDDGELVTEYEEEQPEYEGK